MHPSEFRSSHYAISPSHSENTPYLAYFPSSLMAGESRLGTVLRDSREWTLTNQIGAARARRSHEQECTSKLLHCNNLRTFFPKYMIPIDQGDGWVFTKYAYFGIPTPGL